MDYHHGEGPELPPGSLVLSTTSSKAWLNCKRKYFLQYIGKLPELRKSSFTIGSVVHACLERFLLCPQDTVPHPKYVPDQPVDERGMFAPGSVLFGQTPGSKVELFPVGWQKVKERDGSWAEIHTSEEEWICRDLVQKAIAQGIITRLPDGRVERKFWLRVLSNDELRAAGVDTTGEVWITSLIDYSSVELRILEDHKTSRSAKYLLSAKDLQKDFQVLLYSYVMFGWIDEKSGGPVHQQLRVSHNQLVKNDKDKTPPEVRKTSTYISRAQAVAYFNDLRSRALEMMQLHVAKLEVGEYSRLPQNLDHCGAYGGCQYNMLCLGLQTPESYKQDSQRKVELGGLATFNVDMNPFTPAPMPGMQAPPPFLQPQAAAAPAPVPPAPQPQQAQPQQPMLNIAGARGQVPWAQPNCPVCGGLGLQSNGSHCPLCMAQAPPHLHPTAYYSGFTPDGRWYCAPIQQQQQQAPQAPQAPAPPPQQQSFAFPPQAPQAPVPQAPVPQMPQNVPAAPKAASAPQETQWVDDETGAPHREAEATPAGEQPKKKRGRPTKAEMEARKAAEAASAAPPAEPGTVELRLPAPPTTDATGSPIAEWLRAEMHEHMTPPKGRPSRSGMILLIGCAPSVVVAGPRPVTLSQIMVPIREKFAEVHGSDYWSADAYRRRDWVAAFAPSIAEVFGEGIVQCESPKSDYENGVLINALKGYAAFVFTSNQ